MLLFLLVDVRRLGLVAVEVDEVVGRGGLVCWGSEERNVALLECCFIMLKVESWE